MWSLARRSAWAHRGSLIGTALVLALSGLLLAVAGVLIESGLRTGTDPSVPGSGLLLVLATSFAGTVSTVVLLIVVATVSLALRGRQRELALLRVVGATRAQLRSQIGAEVVLVGLVAAPAGAGAGVLAAGLLTPLLREAGLIGPVGALSLSPVPVLGATLLVLPVAWLAARVASRETLRVAPSQAVHGSTVEAGTIGAVRRGAAVVIGLLGLGAALSPVFVPGTVGSASAASSAFLLVGAAALAGPALVTWSFAHLARARRHLGPAGRLATGNLRGFSRRLSVVVVPLALALTAGTAQTTVDRTVVEASTAQLDDGLRADLVARTSTGSSSQTGTVATLPGVTGTTVLISGAARFLTDPDLDGVVDALAWEPTGIQAVVPGPSGLLLDPDVTAGSLVDLTGPDTIAVSSDASLTSGAQVGSQVSLEWPDGTTSTPTVVAVYERGLGFGDYLTGPGGLPAHQPDLAESLLVAAAPGSLAAVSADLADLGMTTQTTTAYAESATTAGGAERKLSTVLLLALLLFVLLAAANTLVMVTVRRRSELRLYGRTGATRGQLLAMVTIEAALTGALAWLIGTLAVLPAVLGVSIGMLGVSVPPVDVSAYLALSVAVLALPLLTVVPAAAQLLRLSGTPSPGRGSSGPAPTADPVAGSAAGGPAR